MAFSEMMTRETVVNKMRKIQHNLGRKHWDRLGGEARVAAISDVCVWSYDDVATAWADVQQIFDDRQLDMVAADPSYEPLVFDRQSEATQEIHAAIQYLGMVDYDDLPEEERVNFVAIYCLEHALSNVLVAIDTGMDEVAREIIPGFIVDGAKKEKAFVEINSSPANKMLLSLGKALRALLGQGLGQVLRLPGVGA